MNRQILKETGFTRENDPAFEAILDAMEGGSSFEVITQYIKETPSGQKIQMRKESFERAVMEEAAKQNRQLRAPGEDYGGTEEPPSSYDGYVRMAVLYVHTVKGTKHYYGSFGTLEWVIMPFTRMTDAMSFYADDLSWNNKNSNNYGDYGFFWTADYTERYAATNKTYQRSESEERDAHTVERFHDGFYYKFHLPSDAVLSGGQIIYTRFQITICGLGELKNNSTNSFNITLKYAHTRLRISSDLSFSWSTGGKYPGVTFSLAPSIGTTYYGLPCKVS